MALITAQQAVAEYHREMAQHAHHHGGDDMFTFHRKWHQQNPDPTPPINVNSDWGVNLAFGANFLQMHHEMVKAPDGAPKTQMKHQSLVSWYAAKGYELPPEWNPLAEIPDTLAYAPDLSVFPADIRARIQQAADTLHVTPESLMRRKNNHPAFALPKYFTREGVGPGEPGEIYTGARKLGDFQTANQLGCCIVFPHNRWHGAIGGAMSSTSTAIADPIFYLGVHWHVDKVFDEYKRILAGPLAEPLAEGTAAGGAPYVTPFTEEQKRRRESDIAISRQLGSDSFVVQ